MTKRYRIDLHGHTYVVKANSRSEAISKVWAKENPGAVKVQVAIRDGQKVKILSVTGSSEADAKRKLRAAFKASK